MRASTDRDSASAVTGMYVPPRRTVTGWLVPSTSSVTPSWSRKARSLVSSASTQGESYPSGQSLRKRRRGGRRRLAEPLLDPASQAVRRHLEGRAAHLDDVDRKI